MFYLYFLEKKAHCSPSNRFSKHKTFPNFFWSYYSSSFNLENIIATLYPYFIFKNCPVVLIYHSFSLIQTFFLLSIVLFGFSSEYITTTPYHTTPRHGHAINLVLKIFKKPLVASSTGLFKPKTHRHFLPLSLSQISMETTPSDQRGCCGVVFVEKWLLR